MSVYTWVGLLCLLLLASRLPSHIICIIHLQYTQLTLSHIYTYTQFFAEAGEKVVYIQIDAMDGASAKKVTDKLKKMNPDTSYFVSTWDADANKVGLYPLVCKAHVDAGLSAKEWNDACFAAVGAGKGGGKAESAVGNIPGGGDELHAAVKAANAFAATKIF